MQGRDPYIYLHNGKCVKICPTNYTADYRNNICILENPDICTLGSKIEIFSTLYNLPMLNSFAKEYRDEYSYTDKYISMIKNGNYKIIIFKNFECINHFELEIPDIRKYTYKVIQEKMMKLLKLK